MSGDQLSPGMVNSSNLTDAAAEKIRQRRDFWLGLIGSIVVNVLLAIIPVLLATGLVSLKPALDKLTGVAVSVPFYVFVNQLIFGLPWVINIAAIIFVLVIRRPAIALGILASYALAFVLSLIAGLIFLVVCFISLGGYQG